MCSLYAKSKHRKERKKEERKKEEERKKAFNLLLMNDRALVLLLSSFVPSLINLATKSVSFKSHSVVTSRFINRKLEQTQPLVDQVCTDMRICIFLGPDYTFFC